MNRLDMGQIPAQGWVGVVALLFLATFGLALPILLLFYVSAFLGGFLILLYKWQASGESSTLLENIHSDPIVDDTPVSLNQVFEILKKEPPQFKSDKRLTGANIIDEQLQEIIHFTLRDYVHPWYYDISSSEQFLHDIRQTTQNLIITFANRVKEVDWVNYVTRTMVEDFASHIRLFHNAQEKLRKITISQDSPENIPKLEYVFFDLEIEMDDGICRDEICMDNSKEADFLRDISELLLYLMFPDKDFQSKPCVLLIREILACAVFKPLVDTISDPDYVNQYISWLCKETTFSTEAFLTTIKSGATTEELEALITSVDREIFKQRSRDASKSNREEEVVKQQLKSLQYLKQLSQDMIERILSGEDLDMAEEVEADGPAPRPQDLYSLPLNIVLVNSIALSYFMDFMRKLGSESLVLFWHTVECYRVTAEQQLSTLHLQKIQPSSDSSSNSSREPSVDLEGLRAAALNIYQEYLAEDASNRISIDIHIVKRLHHRLKNEEPSELVFDEAQKYVYNILQCEEFFPAFKQSILYIKCLGELDLLKPDTNGKHEEDLTAPTDSSPDLSLADSTENLSSIGSQSSLDHINDADITLTENNRPHLEAYINNASIIQDEKGRKYAIYTIHVVRNIEMDEPEIWEVFRRYSEFYDLHLCLIEKYPSLRKIQLPAKKLMKNTTESFLQKRSKALTAYVQRLLDPDLLAVHPGLLEIMCSFLAPGPFNMRKSGLARRMVASMKGFPEVDTFVNPLKSSVKTVAHTVKSVPGNLVDGMFTMSDKMTDGFSKVFTMNKPQVQPLQNIGRVSSVTSTEISDDENIPLRVMLLLMDEVFELRNRDQWLRRQLGLLLKQFFKAAFGSKMNTRIIEAVEALTSTEQVAEYIKRFKDSFWPCGILAEEAADRSEETKYRARLVAKTELYGSIPDELKNFIGSETTRRGMLQVFDMIQNKAFNKRLIYVILEGIIKLLFPQSNFDVNLRKLLSRSPRIRAKMEEDERLKEKEKERLSNRRR